MDGRTVYLRDVAEVMNTPREQRSLYRLNGKEAVEISIIQQPDASSVRVIEGVKAKLAEIQQDFPRLKFEVAYDNSTFVGFLMDNMVEELVIAVLLTGARRPLLPRQRPRHAHLGHHHPDLARHGAPGHGAASG